MAYTYPLIYRWILRVETGHMKQRKWKFHRECSKSILCQALWLVGIALILGASAAVAGGIAGLPDGSQGMVVATIVGAVAGAIVGMLIGVNMASKVTVPPQVSTQPPSMLTNQSCTSEENLSSRYIANINTHEIHDTANLKSTCMFHKITDSKKVALDTLNDVNDAIEYQGFTVCHWCMHQYETGQDESPIYL